MKILYVRDVPEGLHKKLRVEAAKQDISVTRLVVKILEEHFRKKK